MKWVNAVGKMVPIDLLQLAEKVISLKYNKVSVFSALSDIAKLLSKGTVPIYTFISSLQELLLFHTSIIKFS